MDTPFEFEQDAPRRIVYVRSVEVSELPSEVQGQLPSLDRIYAVHAPDGERLALVADRAQAFALARQNDFAPVTVH